MEWDCEKRMASKKQLERLGRAEGGGLENKRKTALKGRMRGERGEEDEVKEKIRAK